MVKYPGACFVLSTGLLTVYSPVSPPSLFLHTRVRTL